MRRCVFYVAAIIGILKVTALAETNLTPVAVNGFNRDVVVPKNAHPPFTNDAMEFAQGDGVAYYEKGLKGYTNGLPESRDFTNPGDGTRFQFQPYSRKNVLALYTNGTNTGTLTLQGRRKFSSIAILANSADGTAGGTATVTLKFSDGSTYTTNYYAPDWFNNNSTAAYTVALQGVDTIYLSSGFTSGGLVGNPRFYETTIPLYTLGASNKPLASLTFGIPASTKSTGIYAVSGLSSSSVGHPTVTMAPATVVNASTAMLDGQVTRTGGETPTVTLYYGPKNGGKVAAHWSNSVAMGYQSGAFSQNISSLSPGTNYFAACADNACGTVWTPVQHFSTIGTDSPPTSSVAVLTQHNDNNRSGENLQETVLNTSNVNTNSFGLLYSRTVDDQIYAQPLVMTNVSVPGHGSHNLLMVATVNDSIYAFDADDPTVTQPYWQSTFLSPPNIVPPTSADESAIGACGGSYTDFSGNFGIVGTPVIDPASGTLYVVVRTKETFDGSTSFVQRLHALNVATGAEQSNSPVVITASCPGTGDGGTVVNFDPLRENQRPGLVLANGIVYVTWASHCDNEPYHGWVIGYNAKSLKQAAVWNVTPNGQEGGIWMSGQAPAADTDGNIYVLVGNGTVDTTANNDYGESFLKLTPSGTTMKVASYFIPYNWAALNSVDSDLGCAGILLIPGTKLAVGGGKSGVLYVVDRDNMGGLSTGNSDKVTQSWSLESSEIHGSPVWWSSANGSFMYVWPQYYDHVRQFQFNNGLFNTNAFAVSSTTGGKGAPGGTLSISADGSDADTAILWATVNTTATAGHGTVAGTLHAFSAQNVAEELWNSDMVPGNSLGNLAKFVPPTIANGKVYVATFSDQVKVYGLYPQPARISSDRVTASGALRPPLEIRFLGRNNILSWPTNGLPNCRLQFTTNLVSGKWINVTNPTVRKNGAFQVTVPASEPARFYRLSR